MRSSLTSLAIIAGAGLTSLAMAAPNGDFSDVKPFPEDTNFSVEDIGDDVGRGFLPSWTFLRDLTIATRDPSATVSVAGSAMTDAPDPISGSGVFSFEEITDNFDANRLDQCVAIDEDLDITFSYWVYTNRGGVNNSLRFLLNTNFYGDMATCNKDLQGNSTANRLVDGEFDVDRRFHFGTNSDGSDAGVESNTWKQVTEGNREIRGSIEGPMVHPADDISTGAKAVRLSLRPFSNNADSDPDDVRIWIDDVRVEQDGENLLFNHDFSHPDLKDGDFVTVSDSGWQLALTTENDVSPLASAGALPLDFALEGEQAFYFKRLTADDEDSRLTQCISDIPDGDIQPSFSVLSPEPAEGLMAKIRAEFFSDDACEHASHLQDLEGELELREKPGHWQSLKTTDVVGSGEISDGASIRLTLSAQDQSGDNNAPDSKLARTVFMDDVNLGPTLLRPTFSPDSQSFDDSLEVTITGPEGSTLYITMDGTDPDTSSMSVMSGHTITFTETTELRAIASDGELVSAIKPAVYTLRGPGGSVSSSANSSSFGCSLGNGASDPLLPLLALLALMGLMLRRKTQ